MTPGAPGTMQDERWLRGFALLEKYGLSWDLRVPFWHLSRGRRGGAAFPNTAIVLNHTGFPWVRSEEGLSRMAPRHGNPGPRAERSRSKCRNSALRIGLGVRIESPRRARRVAIFGIERAMFATNFPVAGLRIGYGRWSRR